MSEILKSRRKIEIKIAKLRLSWLINYIDWEFKLFVGEINCIYIYKIESHFENVRKQCKNKNSSLANNTFLKNVEKISIRKAFEHIEIKLKKELEKIEYIKERAKRDNQLEEGHKLSPANLSVVSNLKSDKNDLKSAVLKFNEITREFISEMISSFKWNDSTKEITRRNGFIKENEVTLEDYDHSFIFFGPSGHGKSALINSIVNTIIPKEFNEMIITSKFQDFCTVNPSFQGDYIEKENFQDGKQQTEITHFYKILSEVNKKILLIDTPGIVNLKYCETDNCLLDEIKRVLNKYGKNSHMVYVHNSCMSRLDASLSCSLNILRGTLLKFEKEIIVVLTNYRGSKNFKKAWLGVNNIKEFVIENNILSIEPTFFHNPEKAAKMKKIWKNIKEDIKEILDFSISRKSYSITEEE